MSAITVKAGPVLPSLSRVPINPDFHHPLPMCPSQHNALSNGHIPPQSGNFQGHTFGTQLTTLSQSHSHQSTGKIEAVPRLEQSKGFVTPNSKRNEQTAEFKHASVATMLQHDVHRSFVQNSAKLMQAHTYNGCTDRPGCSSWTQGNLPTDVLTKHHQRFYTEAGAIYTSAKCSAPTRHTNSKMHKKWNRKSTNSNPVGHGNLVKCDRVNTAAPAPANFVLEQILNENRNHQFTAEARAPANFVLEQMLAEDRTDKRAAAAQPPANFITEQILSEDKIEPKSYGKIEPKSHGKIEYSDNESTKATLQQLEKYFGKNPEKFSDGIFEVEPRSVKIPLANGTYEDFDAHNKRMKENLDQPVCQCDCLGTPVSEEVEGPYYTHLAAAPSLAGLRKVLETRLSIRGSALRIEEVVYTGKEGRTQDGCPIAKWVFKRSSKSEKALCLARQRPGHKCATAVLCILICLWEGVPKSAADNLFDLLTGTLPDHGCSTNRRCGTNEKRTCACQGLDDSTGGACYTFGCSWSMYFNMCKFARSEQPNKFRLTNGANKAMEADIERNLQKLANYVGDQLSNVAPACHANMSHLSHWAAGCRLGVTQSPAGKVKPDPGPFSGVTAVVDYCSHAHKDGHNMNNGTTVVVTLSRHGRWVEDEKDDDRQLHVLPLYVPKFATAVGKTPGLDTLAAFPLRVRCRKVPLGSCRERAGKPKTQKKRQKNALATGASMPTSPKVAKKAGRPKKVDCAVTPKSKTAKNGHSTINVESLPLDLTSHWAATKQCTTAQTIVTPAIAKPTPVYPKIQQNQTRALPVKPLPIYQKNAQLPLPQLKHVTAQSSQSHQNHLNRNQLPTLTSSLLGWNQTISNVSPWFLSPFAAPAAPPSILPLNGINFATQFSAFPNYEQNGLVQNRTSVSYVADNSANQYPLGEQYFAGNHNYDVKRPCLNHRGMPSAFSAPIHQNAHNNATTPSPQKISQADQRNTNMDVKPDITSSVPEGFYLVDTDNSHAFKDQNIGGVAVMPIHGCVIYEVAKKELHATTALRNPSRRNPARISLVFYQHKKLNEMNHGFTAWKNRNQPKVDQELNQKDFVPSTVGFYIYQNSLNSVIAHTGQKLSENGAIQACHGLILLESEYSHNAMVPTQQPPTLNTALAIANPKVALVQTFVAPKNHQAKIAANNDEERRKVLAELGGRVKVFSR